MKEPDILLPTKIPHTELVNAFQPTVKNDHK